ncbi:MAG TPA: ice-binding family protein [Bacteroidia bacterium]|jgi:gliding motility-associated-like protein|nr:ice-binding family protein [Bacteroidia bacterium]
MKRKILLSITALALLMTPAVISAQAPPLGTAADFVLFTTVGAVSNTGITHLTGNVGTNSGLSTGFGNVDGVMHDNDGASAACAADLLSAYNQLNATVPTFFPAPLLGNGQILVPGVYSISGAATMNLDLILDGQGNSGSVFIIQIQGPFSANANSKVKLINGTLACNVFWKIEGLVSLAAGTTMRGTVIANNAAINMSAGDTLEGRALSTTGAVTVSGFLGYTPIGCGSATLVGPQPPNLLSIACYTIFSSIGPVTNVGVTNVTGDIGSNNGLTTGFNPLLVVGMIHPIPDASTAACATDLNTVYNYLNLLPYDIELLYPAQFGNNLVLTPHSYLMNAACTFTDTLYLNAEGDPNAVFFIRINGALGTSTYSKVNLINGAQAMNVYWEVNGAVTINDYSVFNGTIICNNGAVNLNTGATLNGRVLTTTGAINTAAITAIMTPGCGGLTPPTIITQPTDQAVCLGDTARFIVSATGTGLSYQWRKGNTNLVNGGNISGAQNDTLTIYPVGLSDLANNYNVIVYSYATPSDTSVNVSLTLGSGPAISSIVGNQNACIGDSVGIVLTASGNNLTYQWRKGNVNLINAGNISGATNDTLVIDPITLLDAGNNYNVIISNSCGADTSVNITITVNVAPVIVAQTISQVVCAGDSVGLYVAATGTNLTYQWRKGNVDLVNSGNISGVTNDTLVINPVTALDAGINYNVIVTGPCGSDTSANITISVGAATAITTQPVSQTVCSGDSVAFIVHATGTGLTYQWRKGIVNLLNAGNISGTTNDTLVIDPATLLDGSVNYNVIVSGSCGSDTSVNFSLIINTAPNITSQPSDQAVCEGNSVSFTVTATGSGITYQWKKGSVNLVNAGNISGATSATLTINPANLSDAAVNYNVVVSGTCLPNDTSIYVILTVDSSPVAAASSNTPVCTNADINLFAQAALNATYSWAGPNNFSSSDQNPVISSATTAFGGTYTLTVTANGCTSAPAVTTVVVNDCLTDFNIPEGFSPNGDGVNDLFVIRGIEFFPQNTFTIYNRWGNEVFSANPYTNTWDGKATKGITVGGDVLPVGTYFYILDLGNGTPVYKGTIYLNQ